MKFTAQSAILAALFCSFVLATPTRERQMAPFGHLTTPSLTKRVADPAEGGCAKKTTCEACIAVKGKSGSACGYDGTTKRCAGLSTAGANPLARTTAECKAITSQQNSQHASAATAQANVDAAWNSMKAHVFGGAKKATAGTHLTKEWLEKNPKVKLQSNPKTGISVTVDGKSSKNSNPKTLWNNNRESGHQYTETDVERMCKAAISLVLAKLKTDTLPKSHTTQSFSVLAFGSTNICVSVQGDTSCFPMSNQIANAEAGQECDSR